MSDTTVIETIEETSTTTDQDVLGEAGKKALDNERDARKAAEKTARDTAKELETLKAAAAKAKDDEAAEQGKWQELAEKREADLTTATTNIDTITAERDEYRTLVEADVKTAWKDIPEKVRKTYTGADDDVLAKKSHMVLMAELIEELADKKAKPRGAGFDPTPGTKALDIQQEAAKARARGAYRT